MDHKLRLGGDEDTLQPVDGPAVAVVERRAYRVVADCGIFKNGRQYAAGEIVLLVRSTGERFVAAGDVVPADDVDVSGLTPA